MHHRTVRRAAAVAATASLTLTAAAVPGIAGARTAHATHAAGARIAHAAAARTIHVVEHAVTDTEIPLAPGGKDRKGDILTFNNPIYNAANRVRAGHDEGFCTRIQVQLGIWECLWTTFLKGGQITVQGPYYDTRNSVLSITGGTGAYAGARGEMVLRSRAHGTQYDFIFHLM